MAKKKTKKKRRPLTKPLECWAPVSIKTGHIRVARYCLDSTKPENYTSHDGEVRTHVRVLVTPIRGKSK